ncbi:hypothetical protein LPU83_pLPU83d_1073 (plasmid) [Rhizobium favelukesii]|uniref:Uncharacterized protein n=1 Tax=Rhizobium favelukesii TaxID=348824 RepID=W6RUW8_9HYPH|nr:hypothetical protein LPU83_pLPU83d_1073 [Rhizobium favelukesii]
MGPGPPLGFINGLTNQVDEARSRQTVRELALQLHFSFEMSSSSGRLMGASPA